MSNIVKEKIEKLTNEELVNAATKHKDEYSRDALRIMNSELLKRKIPFQINIIETPVEDINAVKIRVNQAIIVLGVICVLSAGVCLFTVILNISGSYVDFTVTFLSGCIMSISSLLIMLLKKSALKNNSNQRSSVLNNRN